MAQDGPLTRLEHVIEQATAAQAIMHATGRLGQSESYSIARVLVSAGNYFLNPQEDEDR